MFTQITKTQRIKALQGKAIPSLLKEYIQLNNLKVLCEIGYDSLTQIQKMTRHCEPYIYVRHRLSYTSVYKRGPHL